MKTFGSLRNILFFIVGAAIVLIVCAWVGSLLAGGMRPRPVANTGVSVDLSDRALIQRGSYVAALGDCAACHTKQGGRPFAGGLPLATPIGKVYSTNITPDKNSGIGNYSLDDFARAVRTGVRRDGGTLYPAMPYPSYVQISDNDLTALYAYFMHGVAPADEPNRKTDIAWPLSLRWPLTYWRLLFAPGAKQAASTQVQASTTSSASSLERGRYLVEGLGHCGSCHTPRGVALQEIALTDSDGPAYLSGGIVDNYVANNLRADDLSGLGRWKKEDIVRFLREGRNTDTAAFGGMRDVVQHSTQYMTDADLDAIATYLMSLHPTSSNAQYKYVATSATALQKADLTARGSIDYLNSCAACHLSSGKGYSLTFPGLAGNPVVNSENPDSLINIVLNGSDEVTTVATPTRFTMPAFGDRLSDAQVADVVTFIRSSWGNSAPAVDEKEVVRLRSQTQVTVAKDHQ
ncbi:putative diheme cytochrome c-553 [Paraburkholderia caribensis MBA4]|uniref:Putative diheme cytochrome c-553 n=1 Tax=Paraburkholderia caribensis MBA4 TaxID=1323664 RepID=A0A0P0RID0_9BURK|nr:cytochrome c [Paraburkholderia caribensis]ALL68506.1 putative diheme cytochrome c-553 [Paraburkholderia caribensis MBA4]